MKWLLLVALVACEHETHKVACTEDRDCPHVAAAATCSYTCIAGTCSLAILESHAGAGPCYGSKRDGTSIMKLVPQPVLVQCDVNAGVYCDGTLKRCAAVKPRGAACSVDVECGDDGRCAAGACAPGLALDENCHEAACAKGLFCNASDRCEPRRALAAACVLDDECVSLHCEREHCVAARSAIACPVDH